jgi:hypothetical protein
MASAGNSYVVELGQTHLGWGHHRYTNSRDIIYRETYIPIPYSDAQSFNIYNSNFNPNRGDVLGVNVFNCTSADGFFTGVLKSSGCKRAGDIYAKNLHGNDNLKALDPWFTYCHAQVGDHVEVTWTSPTDIVIRHY